MPEAGGPRPRIAFATSVWEGVGVGGHTFVGYLREAARRGELDVVFFSDRIEAERERERPVRVPAWKRRVPGKWALTSADYARAIAREHARRPFDVLWANNVIQTVSPAWRRGALAGVPVVGMINDYVKADARAPWAGGSASDWFWRGVERRAARRADAVVVNSAMMERHIAAAYGLPPARVETLYKAVDVAAFAYAERELPAGGPVRVLFLKGDPHRGGLGDLLGAIARLPERWALTVAGPGDAAAAPYREQAEALGIASRVAFVGPQGRAAVRGLLGNHDLVCMPSRQEALGVAYLEALASGTPVVARDIGGVAEVLADGRAGVLVPDAAPAAFQPALADALAGLAADPAARLARVRAGRAHAATFSTEAMVARIDQIASTIRPS